MPGPYQPIAPRKSLEELAEFYKAGHRPNVLDLRVSELPTPPKPSMFQADPFVVGSPEMARAAKTLLDLDPFVKNNVRSVTIGPTTSSMNEMLRSGIKPDQFSGTTLMGVYGLGGGDVGINPSDPDPMHTMAHEFAHAGWRSEADARKAETFMGPTQDVLLRQGIDKLKLEVNDLIKRMKAKGMDVSGIRIE